MHNHNQRWLNLTPAGLAALSDHEFYLFAQWLHGGQVAGVVKGAGFADFTYLLPGGQKELLRVYTVGQVPVSMLYDVQQAGQGYKRVGVYTRAKKNPAADRLTQQFPLAFEVVDLDGMAARILDKQRRPAARIILGRRPLARGVAAHHDQPGAVFPVGVIVAGLIILSVVLVVLAVWLGR